MPTGVSWRLQTFGYMIDTARIGGRETTHLTPTLEVVQTTSWRRGERCRGAHECAAGRVVRRHRPAVAVVVAVVASPVKGISLERNVVPDLAAGRLPVVIVTVPGHTLRLDRGGEGSERHVVVHDTLRPLLGVSAERILSHPLGVRDELRYAFHLLQSMEKLFCVHR